MLIKNILHNFISTLHTKPLTMKRFTLSILLALTALTCSGQSVSTVMPDSYKIPGHTVTVEETGKVVVRNATLSETTVGLYDVQAGNFNQYFRLRKGQQITLPATGSIIKVFNANTLRTSTPANGVTITRMIRDSELPIRE